MADPGGPKATPWVRRTVVVLALVMLGAVGGLWAIGTSPSAPASSLDGLAAGSPAPATTPTGSTTPTTPATPTDPTGATSTTDAGARPHAGDPLTLVGLGDSVPSATTCGCTGYVELLGQSLHNATQRPVVVHNDAVGGWTTSDVEQDLRSGQTATDLSHADLVTVEIGANDFDLGRVD
ncbi:MAG: GDSL-type esterase/lipase family protein, partial [Terracoccus sp.]